MVLSPVAPVQNRPAPRGRPVVNADTVGEPEGITRRLVLNILESFFRAPVRHLLPLIALVVLGALTGYNGTQNYRASGSLRVSYESLLSDLTNSAQARSVSYQSPAESYAGQLTALLSTREFQTQLTALNGLELTVQVGALPLADLPKLIQVTPVSESVIAISALTRDPELSLRLVQSTQQAYSDYLVADYRRESESTVAQLQHRLDDRAAEVERISGEITTVLGQNPTTPIDERSVTDQFLLQQLQGDLTAAQAALADARAQLDTAVTQNDQAAVIVQQRVQELDAPVLPTAPEGRLKRAVLTVGVFFVLGALLSLASVVLSSFLDRTVRVPGDITSHFGVDVLAVVPRQGGRRS